LYAIVIACVLTAPATLSDIQEYQQCLETKHQVEYVSQWHDLLLQYFNEKDAIKSSKIIYCESKGKATAVGKNSDGTYDVGLWQFNDNTWKWLAEKLNITSDRTNPTVSTAVAKWLIENDGWYHWNSSGHCWKESKKWTTKDYLSY